MPWGEAFDLQDGHVAALSDKLGMYRTDPAFYMKGKIAITDNRPDIQVEDVEIGRVPVPADAVPAGTLNAIAASAIGSVEGLSVESLTVEDGQLHFQGTYPDTMLMVTE